jgi:ribosomal protein S3AE
MKEWYDIVSPAYFGGANLVTTPSSQLLALIGRTIEATLTI